MTRGLAAWKAAQISPKNIDVSEDPDQVVGEFRTRFADTQRFDPFAGARFAAFLLRAHDAPGGELDRERAHQRIEEAQLFIEAAHACYDRMQEKPA